MPPAKVNECLVSPTDATPIFESFRGAYGTELLTAAVAHFDLFPSLNTEPQTFESLSRHLGLAVRPMHVLVTTLLAMGLLESLPDGRLTLTPLGRHLVPGGPFDVSDYVGLAASAPGVLEMVERLKTNRPAGLEEDGAGAAFIYRQGIRSAMDEASLSRHFTMALAGRAKIVAPVLAERLDLSEAQSLLDVGGGTGIYSIAFLQRFPNLTATIIDRPDVLKIAAQMADDYGVRERLRFQAGDMFADDYPQADAILLSNILHDWDVPECKVLVARAAAALQPGGRFIVHDVLLDDDLAGPLPIALYSAALFTLTEGRAYSAAEYTAWLRDAGLTVTEKFSTAIHCHAMVARHNGKSPAH